VIAERGLVGHCHADYSQNYMSVAAVDAASEVQQLASLITIRYRLSEQLASLIAIRYRLSELL